MTSVLAFQNYLNRNKLQSPYYFHVGSRLGQILHARLRMRCSALHADLYRKTFPHPESGSDRTIASVRQVTALVMLYIGRLVTCGIDYSFTP